MSWKYPSDVSMCVEEFRDIQYKSDLGSYMITTLESRELGLETRFDDSQVRDELSICLELVDEILAVSKTGSGSICIKEILSETEFSTNRIVQIRDNIAFYRDNLTLNDNYERVRNGLTRIETIATSRISKLNSSDITAI